MRLRCRLERGTAVATSATNSGSETAGCSSSISHRVFDIHFLLLSVLSFLSIGVYI